MGLIFRSAGLNERSVSGLAKGRSRLTVDDREFLTKELGIKTEFDLRTKRETTVATAFVEATRLGIEIGIFNGPGWSMAGGPWVKPEQAKWRKQIRIITMKL